MVPSKLNESVVIFYRNERYTLCTLADWKTWGECYYRSPKVEQTARHFVLEKDWFSVLYPVQWTLRAQKVLKEIYEEHVNGNKARNG